MFVFALLFFFFLRKIREEKYRLLSKPRCGGVRPRSGAMERRRLKEAGVCGALPKASHGHPGALSPVSNRPTVLFLLLRVCKIGQVLDLKIYQK